MRRRIKLSQFFIGALVRHAGFLGGFLSFLVALAFLPFGLRRLWRHNLDDVSVLVEA